MLVKKLVTLLPPGTSEETIKKSITVLRAKNGKLSGNSTTSLLILLLPRNHNLIKSQVEHWYPSCSWHISLLFQAQNHNLTVIYRHETHLFQAGLQARLLLRSTNLFKEEKCSFKENIFHLNIQSSQTYVPNVKTLIQTAKWFMAFLLLWHWKQNQKDFLAALV